MSRPSKPLPHGRLFTVKDAILAGVSKATLYRMVGRGEVSNIGPGLFMATEVAGDLALFEATARAPMATICLTSALARYGLIDDIPDAWDLALPRDTHQPTNTALIRWHSFDANTFLVERDFVDVEDTEIKVAQYSAARSIVDAFRLRDREGYELGLRALRAWLRRPGNHPAELLQLATRLPRAAGPLRQALEYLT